MGLWHRPQVCDKGSEKVRTALGCHLSITATQQLLRVEHRSPEETLTNHTSRYWKGAVGENTQKVSLYAWSHGGHDGCHESRLEP